MDETDDVGPGSHVWIHSPRYKDHRMSADLGLDALGGAGHLITDAVGIGRDSLGRLPSGLASRLQR